LTGSRSRAILLLLLAALLWSSGGLFIKSIDWPPLAIAGARSAIAGLLMLLLGYRQLEWRWSKYHIIGAVSYAGIVTLFVVATKLTTAANAIVLQYTAPLYVAMLGGWFLGEPTSRRDWGIIFIALAGMSLFFLDHLSPGNIWGNILAMLSGLAFAIMVLCTRRQKDGSPLTTLFLGNMLTAVIGLPFMWQAVPSSPDCLALLFLGIFQLGLPYICYAAAIRHVTALEGILIPMLEPLANPLWVFLVLRERPGKWALLGGIVLLSAVTTRSLLTMARNEAA
jgi:drug/metabolite transporter (DMT)-like permease